MSAFNDIIESVVTQVRAEYDPTNGKRPFWFFGYFKELLLILAEKDQSNTYKFDKYPLIALLTGYKTIENDASDEVSNITILIIKETDINSRTKNRIVANYEPVLRPLKVLLKKYIKRSKNLTSDNMYSWEVEEFPYWGDDPRGANVGNDALDAIVITGLELRVNRCLTLPAYRVTEASIQRITENGNLRIVS